MCQKGVLDNRASPMIDIPHSVRKVTFIGRISLNIENGYQHNPRYSGDTTSTRIWVWKHFKFDIKSLNFLLQCHITKLNILETLNS